MGRQETGRVVQGDLDASGLRDRMSCPIPKSRFVARCEPWSVRIQALRLISLACMVCDGGPPSEAKPTIDHYECTHLESRPTGLAPAEGSGALQEGRLPRSNRWVLIERWGSMWMMRPRLRAVCA